MSIFRLRRTHLSVKLENIVSRDREADIESLGSKAITLFKDVVRVLTRSGFSHKNAVNKAHQHLIYNTNVKQF